MIVWCFSPFSPLPEPGAHESRTAALARYLTEAGHNVVWFSMDWDHRQKKKMKDRRWKIGEDASKPAPNFYLLSSNFQSILIPVPPYSKNISLRRFWSHRVWGNRLVRYAKQQVASGTIHRPDLILASSPPLDAPRAAFRLQKHFGCRVKIDLTDLWPHSFSAIPYLPSPIFHLLLRRVHAQWRRADGISVMSQEYLDQVHLIAPGQDTHLCYIGGNIRRERLEVRGQPARRTPRRPGRPEVGNQPNAPPCLSPIFQLPTPTPKASFLYLGALTDSYDFDTLFKAAKILAEEGHDFHIHIAGSGPQEKRLQQTVNHQHLTGNITFHGFLQEADMNALCAQCQVGLNIIRPGLHITMPHKLNDYLCSGLAVINSLPGEAESLLARYHAGLTYPAGDPKALADAMRHYIQDPDIKKAPQSGALELAEILFDRGTTYPAWATWIVDR
jgi:glycosyltransferase involved in cell wall biosynthesis